MAIVLDQQNTGAIVAFYDTFQWDAHAQYFKPGQSGELSKIVLYLQKLGAPNNLIVEIQEVSEGKPNGVILASEEINVSLVPTSFQEFEIVFSTPAILICETVYAIVFYDKLYWGDWNNHYSISATTNDYINGNKCYTFNGAEQSVWYLDNAHDFYFKTYVDTSAPIPAIYDIINDFRLVGNMTMVDIRNDFRIGGISLIDIINDFRMVGNFSLIDIKNDFRLRKTLIYDIINKFNLKKEDFTDINNKFNLLMEGCYDLNNKVAIVCSNPAIDIANDFRTQKLETVDIRNDFRMLFSYQMPNPEFPNAGVQSIGKNAITVIINNVDKTAIVNIDSLSWTERLNSAFTATFKLGVSYDSFNCPIMEQTIEILFNGNRKFYGYITNISKESNPEGISITAQNEYWNINKNEVNFKVGRKLTNETETYYDTINQALSAIGIPANIGNFIPSEISLTGALADVISQLIQECGQYSWYMNPYGQGRLWTAGRGNIIELEKQTLNSNIALYQVIEHNIETDSPDTIVNKYHVIMGDDVKPGYNNDFRFAWLYYKYLLADPKYIKHENESYSSFPYLKENRQIISKISWFDRRNISNMAPYETECQTWKITVPSGYTKGFPLQLAEEYVWENYNLVHLVGVGWDTTYLPLNGYRSYSYGRWCHRGGVYPEGKRARTFDITMGSYPQTMQKTLVLSGCNVQYGCNYVTWEGHDWQTVEEHEEIPWGKEYKIKWTEYEADAQIIGRYFHIPSWNDIEYATDYARWQLSKTCDLKTKGTIKITLDCADVYQLELGKRIHIAGILDEPVNIVSIDYDVSSWMATISVESNRYYNRTVSIPIHEREP